MCSAAHRLAQQQPCVAVWRHRHDAVSSCLVSGLTVQQYHAESGGGQFELAMAHAGAFEAADALVLQREAVVDTAAQRGHPASFLPKLWEDRGSSGAHIHFSVWKVMPGRRHKSGDCCPSSLYIHICGMLS
jgi:glutamine synthetase